MANNLKIQCDYFTGAEGIPAGGIALKPKAHSLRPLRFSLAVFFYI